MGALATRKKWMLLINPPYAEATNFENIAKGAEGGVPGCVREGVPPGRGAYLGQGERVAEPRAWLPAQRHQVQDEDVLPRRHLQRMYEYQLMAASTRCVHRVSGVW